TLIGNNVVVLEIGDKRHKRSQMQERCITLICFGNQVATMPPTRMNARRFYQPTVHEGWVESRFCVDAGNHRGGCRFAVRSCNGDAMTKTHYLSQHVGTTDHRNTRFMSCD